MRQRDYHVCCTGIEFFSFLGFFSVSSSSVSFVFLYGLYEGFLDSILIQCSESIALYSFTVSSVAQSCLETIISFSFVVHLMSCIMPGT